MLTNGEIKVLGGSIFSEIFIEKYNQSIFFESLGVGLIMIAKIPFSFRQYMYKTHFCSIAGFKYGYGEF